MSFVGQSKTEFRKEKKKKKYPGIYSRTNLPVNIQHDYMRE